jgi:hypothetical protein
VPERTCVSCQNKGDKSQFIRITRDFLPDFEQKAHGRGAYVCNNNECIGKLYKGKTRLGMSLRCPLPGKDALSELARKIQTRVVNE